ncbi:hypothetical protein ACFL2U_02640 [Patescibacteria group bacterium]
MAQPKPGIWISTPDTVHNSYGLQIYSTDTELVARFEALCRERLINNRETEQFLGSFFQGGHNETTWKYFEFLRKGPDTSSEDQDKIMEICQKIADLLNLDLEIDLN